MPWSMDYLQVAIADINDFSIIHGMDFLLTHRYDFVTGRVKTFRVPFSEIFQFCIMVNLVVGPPVDQPLYRNWLVKNVDMLETVGVTHVIKMGVAVDNDHLTVS